ncbi:MAG: hypothetical protein V4667_03140 [Bacteroidota bacterium]
MKQKLFFWIFGVICLIASIAMFVIGTNSGHLSELADFFYVPIPLGIISIMLGFRKAS